MPNTKDFTKFINQHGQVNSVDANRYASYGRTIMDLAAAHDTDTFLKKMQELEVQFEGEESLEKKIYTYSKYAISNMASCLLYAQNSDNFNLNQGFAKGSNINQYGDKKTSEKVVKNLMTYFSQSRPNVESGYHANSLHTTWRSENPLPEGIDARSLYIDIDSDAKKGSIPAPLKGMHAVQFVPGVDDDGVVKLLIKQENWGMKQYLHQALRALTFFISFITSDKKEGLENRYEFRSAKEGNVSASLKEIQKDVERKIGLIPDSPCKAILQQINREINSSLSNGTLNQPIQILQKIELLLDNWMDENKNNPHFRDIETLRWNVIDEKEKYGSLYQKGSEVRLKYEPKTTESETRMYARVDNSAISQKLSELKRELKEERVNLGSADEPSSETQSPRY